jgi:hypothetical protein
MKNPINIEHLKFYQKYNGDIDGFLRQNQKTALEVYENDIDNIWSEITNKLQDIKLINERLCSEEYSLNSLIDLKQKCDEETYLVFISKIDNFKNFKKISEILKKIRDKINPKTDTVWAGFDNPKILKEELNQDIEKIEQCDYETLEKVNIQFMPTSTYQELSLSNGWSEEYIKISNEFDDVYRKTIKENKNTETKKKWWKFS